jgi:hypothetical protein
MKRGTIASGVGGPILSSGGGGGHNCPYESTEPPIRLQVGLRRRRAYKMACFKELNNCNGTRTVSRIVMAFFKNAEIIMAQI